MPSYWQHMSVNQLLFAAFALLLLPVVAGMVYVQKRHDIPWPMPPRWPTPLPPGWRSFVNLQSVTAIIFGAAAIVAGWRYYLHLGVMEARGGVTLLWIGFAMIYKLAGRTGVLCLACLIGIGFWWLAAVGLKKLRSAR